MLVEITFFVLRKIKKHFVFRGFTIIFSWQIPIILFSIMAPWSYPPYLELMRAFTGVLRPTKQGNTSRRSK